MIALRPGTARGATQVHGTHVRHAFSFGDYFDPAHMGFGALRVLNEIALAPGASIEPERRANIEILCWVIEGRVRRTFGEVSTVLEPGDLHHLGAGRGIDDALANDSAQEPARVLQFWFAPGRVNAPPVCAHRRAAADGADVVLLASGDGRDGSLAVRAPIELRLARLEAGASHSQSCCLGKRLWMQVARGDVEVNGVRAMAGDAAVALNERHVELRARVASDVLLVGLDAG